MEHVPVDDVDPETWDPEERSHERRPLSAALGTTDVAVNHYTLAPGERFSGSRHAHLDQEEVFIVLAGTATFDVRPADAGEARTVTVGEGEAVRFAPGDFQTGYNDGEERVVALGLGAPPGTSDLRFDHAPGVGDLSCPDCGHDCLAPPGADADAELVCPECGAGVTPGD